MRLARWVPGLAAAILLSLNASSLPGPKDPNAPVRGVPGPTLSPISVDVRALPDAPEGVSSPERPRDLERGPELRTPHGIPLPPGATVLMEFPARSMPPIGRPEGPKAEGALATAPSPALDISFSALADDGVTVPPDTNGAVGISQVVTMLNSQFRVQDRAGNSVKTVTIESFWGKDASANAFLSDPRTLYSAAAGRWFAVILSGRATPAGATTPEFLLAVSRTEDAAGVWDIYTVPVGSVSEGYSGDFPTVGYSRGRFVVQLNLYNRLFGSFLGSRIYVFDRAALESGTLVTPTLLTASEFGSTQVPSVAAEPDEGGMYLLEDWNGNDPAGGLLRLFQITGPPGSESLAPVAFLGTPDRWLDFPGGPGNLGPQSGSTTGIATNFADIGSSVVFRNGFLWAAHTIFLPADAPTRSAVQWWQVETDGTVAQRGRIDDPSGKFFYAFPSIAVDRDNDVVIGCARFAADRFAGSVYAYRSAADPEGTLRAESPLKDGEATYLRLSPGDARNRWGDYSATVADPVGDTGFWTLQEFAAAGAGGASTWGTWWGHLNAEAPVSPASHFEFLAAPLTVGVPVRFHDRSSGGPIAWAWNFGDGTTSSAKDPRKTFASPGTYRVALTVSNRAGSSSSETTLVVAPAPGRSAPRRVPPRSETPRVVVRPG